MKRFITFLICFLTVFALFGIGSAQVFDAGHPEPHTMFAPIEGGMSLTQFTEDSELNVGAALVAAAVPDEETTAETPPETSEESVTEETITDETKEETTSEMSIGRFDLTAIMIVALLLLGLELYSKRLKQNTRANLT